MNKHITYKQLAEYLGVSRRTVERHIPEWLAEGKISIVKIGHAVRIPQSDVEKLINSLKIGKVVA